MNSSDLPQAEFTIPANVRLVPTRSEYAEHWLKWRSESNTVKYNPVVQSALPELRARMEKMSSDLSNLKGADEFQFFIEYQGNLVGTVSLKNISHMMMYAEIGYDVAQDFQGKGIGTAALKLFIEKIFVESSLRRLLAHVALENHASRRILEKMGFRQEGVLREHFIINGTPTDEVVYGILRTDWLARSGENRERHPVVDLPSWSRLPGSELTSLLIDVFSERAKLVAPASTLQSWQRDRFVEPSRLSPLDFLRFDSMAFEAAANFEPIELSPLCPFATNSSVAPMSQKKVLSTIRNSEVVADSTNVMALECAIRRRELIKDKGKDSTVVKLCSSHRLVRVQQFNFPGAKAHFRVFSMCSAGRDTGSFKFEVQSVAEHVAVFWSLFQKMGAQGFVVRNIRVGLYGENPVLHSLVADALVKALPEIRIQNAGTRESSYYPSISFKLWAKNHAGTELELADGGFTDWTQKLVGSSKERLMISGIGTDRTIENFFCVPGLK